MPVLGQTSFLPQSKTKSRWTERSFLDTHNTIGHLVIFNHLYLKPHVGPPQTNTASLLKPPVRWRPCISHCLSSHISGLAYPCSVGNIKTPHFLLPIQSRIYNFQAQVSKREQVWDLWCSGSMQTPPRSQREVFTLHGWGGSGASLAVSFIACALAYHIGLELLWRDWMLKMNGNQLHQFAHDETYGSSIVRGQ